MPDKNSPGQADKKAAEDKTVQLAAERADEARKQAGEDEPRSAAEKSLTDPNPANPFPNYDVMTLEQLRELAKARKVEINRDVEKAHLITELRAADTHG